MTLFPTASIFLLPSLALLSLTASFLSVCTQFFSEYEKLLLSENYVTKRQSLKVRTAWLVAVNRPHGVMLLYWESYFRLGV